MFRFSFRGCGTILVHGMMRRMTMTTTPAGLEWTITDRLRKARETAGLTQSQLANLAGVHTDTVSNYENPKYTKRRRILTILGVWERHTDATEDWLLGDDVARLELVELTEDEGGRWEWSDGEPYDPARDGAPPGIRTQNLRIKSPLLCR